MKINKDFSILIIVFLCGLAGFCIWRYLLANKDLASQKILFVQLEEKNISILKRLDSQITKGKQLAEEKKGLQEELRVNSRKLGELKKTLGSSKQELVKMKSISEELSRANQKLREKQNNLQARIEELAGEKKELLAKLSSIDELNALIEDLKKAGRIKVDRKIPVGKKTKKDADESMGNRGYITYHGMPTYKSRVSIRVVPGD